MIEQTEVDGVPTLLAPTSGPMHAGLVFRVGRADERLARGGITHLVEHLALHRHGLTDYHFNGATGSVFTFFHAQGSADDVAAFLTGVCTALTDLPVERLETEKAILRTESASRRSGVGEPLSLWRHGARDHGLHGYPEWGLTQLTPDEVRHWAQAWFTRDNAVLWVAGDGVPAGLRLPLRGGVRQPVPTASSALPSTPAYFAGPTQSVAFDAVVRRRVAGSVFSGVLERELFRNLRQEDGLSYTASSTYEARGDGFATVIALADALPEKQGAVLGGFVDVLTKLKVGRIDKADVDAVVTKSDEALRHPDADASRLVSMAANLLTGYPNQTTEQLRAELRAVTPEAVHEVAVEAMGTGLLMVPRGHQADWAGFVEAPTASVHAVTGTRYASRRDAKIAAVIGPEGVSVVSPDEVITVRYAQCVALLAWPDGARQLVGEDAISVRLEPTLFEMAPSAMAAIDAALSPSLVVPMPARKPDDIPQPPQPAAAARTGRGWLEVLLLVVLFFFTSLAGLVALLATFGVAIDPSTNSDAGVWVVVTVLWCFAAGFALPAIVLLRRRRRQAARVAR
jgi:predicted Zn-dependent peptidase